MNQVTAIIQKELKQFFYSPVAYVVLFITLIIFNAFFYLIIDQSAEASLRDVFKVIEFMLVFIVPLLTMRSFAEERASGTFELLMTSPISNWSIVLGKFFGSLLFFIIFIALTIPYYIILEIFSQPDRLAIIVGYFGLLLEIMSFVAIGILFSSVTKSQIVAAISSYVVIFMLYFSVSAMKFLTGVPAKLVRYSSLWSHSESLMSGLLQTQDVFYFLSLTIFCLVLTRITLEQR